MKKIVKFITILMSAGAVLLMGCAQPKPFDYHPATEIPQGPGVFSGKDGEFKIYDSKKAASPPGESRSVTDPNVTPEEIEAFRQFQQWRKDQKEFEVFQQWKQSGQGTAEYEEFLEWQRWQEFKKWQESSPKDR